jgi:hypothetical protein
MAWRRCGNNVRYLVKNAAGEYIRLAFFIAEQAALGRSGSKHEVPASLLVQGAVSALPRGDQKQLVAVWRSAVNSLRVSTD